MSIKVCGYCEGDITQKKSGEDESLDYCPLCDKIVEGNTKEVKPAKCYFCSKEIKREHSTRIAESPKDYEAGGIRVWICTGCETKTREN